MRARLGVLVVGWVAIACAGRSEKASADPSGSPSTTATTAGAGGLNSSTVAGGAQTSGTTAGSGGVTSMTATAAGGSGATATGVGGLAGADGSADLTASSSGGSSGGTDTTPRPCNSSDGSGCNEGEVCLDLLSDGCTSADCTGYCASTLTPSTCEGGLAQCIGNVTCPGLPPECPQGFVSSIVDECWGPCVPADCCACSAEDYCLLNDVSCDLSIGRCVVPAAPEPRCFLPPPDPDDCPGEVPSFVFVDGECQESPWGRCDSGSDNRFNTIEECLRRCQGLPQQGECPDARVPKQICLACGGGGGCRQTTTVCAQPCETSDECAPGMTCFDETCGVNMCF